MAIRRLSALDRLRQLRQAKAAEGFNEQDAFEFVTNALVDSNKRIQELRDWQDSLGEAPLEEDEEVAAPLDDEGKEEFGAFVESYLAKAKECREFLLSALWNLWGIEEREIEEEEIEEEVGEDLEEV